jgi:hypothetical protein
MMPWNRRSVAEHLEIALILKPRRENPKCRRDLCPNTPTIGDYVGGSTMFCRPPVQRSSPRGCA